MKKLIIVGIGMGETTITMEAKKAIDNASVLFGAERMVNTFAADGKRLYPIYTADKINEKMTQEGIDEAVLLVSGDTGFYSAAASVKNKLPDFEVEFITGISSVNYFFSKIQLPWQNAKLVSIHGRECNIVDAVRRNEITFSLTGGNTKEYAKALCEAGYEDLKVYVGENLSMEEEKVSCMSIKELSETDTASLTVIVIENKDADSRVRFGIADSEFTRTKVPMTKSAVRAVTMSKLQIKDTDTCLDIGCGTGSCTVEMALAAYNGHVYSVDKNEDAVAITKENVRKFHIGNVSASLMDASEASKVLPLADVAFIGGGGDEVPEIIDTLVERNESIRIVVNAITLESIGNAVSAFAKNGIEPEIVQMTFADSKKAGNKHLMMGQNPIYIITGEK